MALHIAKHGTRHSSGKLLWGGVKEFADGSLGSRTALMHAPYSDMDAAPQAPPTNAAPPTSASAPGDQDDGSSGRVSSDGGDGEATNCSQDAMIHTDVHGHGTRMLPMSELFSLVKGADAAGLTVAVHAIGDKAVDEVLEVYRQVRLANAELHATTSGVTSAGFGNTNMLIANVTTGACEGKVVSECEDPSVIKACIGPMHRIEHFQHLSGPGVAGLAADLGVAVTPNPLHLAADGELMQRRLGSVRAGAGRSYAFRSVQESGAMYGMSTDWPVTDLNPLAGTVSQGGHVMSCIILHQ